MAFQSRESHLNLLRTAVILPKLGVSAAVRKNVHNAPEWSQLAPSKAHS